MSVFLYRLDLLRSLTIWAIMFVLSFSTTLLLSTFYLATENILVLVVSQMIEPLAYLLFAWLFFRHARFNDWTVRLSTGALWIMLSLIAMAFLIGPVYGYSWSLLFSLPFLKGQSINIVAILVAGYLTKKSATPVEIPKSVLKKMAKRDEVSEVGEPSERS